MEQYLTGYRQFLENLAKSSHTVKQYVLDAKHFLHYWSNHDNLAFPELLKLYREHLIESYDATASINRKLAGTRKFVHFLYDRAFIESFDETLFEPLQQQDVTLNILSNAQITEIEDTLLALKQQASELEHTFLAQRHLTMFYLFLTTGMKPIECVKLKWVHILEDELVVVQKHAPRRIDMPASLFQQFLLLKDVSQRLFGEQQFVWLGIGNKKGEPITEKTVERFFTMLSKLVGFKVTATICRYTMIANEEDKSMFDKIGYSRKDILTERLNKIIRHT